jgi:hypothetical protein
MSIAYIYMSTEDASIWALYFIIWAVMDKTNLFHLPRKQSPNGNMSLAMRALSRRAQSTMLNSRYHFMLMVTNLCTTSVI